MKRLFFSVFGMYISKGLWTLTEVVRYAELSKRKGDRIKAKETLNKAIEIHKECGADEWVEKAEEKMAGLL